MHHGCKQNWEQWIAANIGADILPPYRHAVDALVALFKAEAAALAECVGCLSAIAQCTGHKRNVCF
jgi:hypothetical protein